MMQSMDRDFLFETKNAGQFSTGWHDWPNDCKSIIAKDLITRPLLISVQSFNPSHIHLNGIYYHSTFASFIWLHVSISVIVWNAHASVEISYMNFDDMPPLASFVSISTLPPSLFKNSFSSIRLSLLRIENWKLGMPSVDSIIHNMSNTMSQNSFDKF